MSGAHSIIPPSSAARRVQCNGSAMMELMHPDTTSSEEAMEGEASHEMAARMVEEFSRGISPPRSATGVTASNGVVITQESHDCALMYAEDIRDVMIKTGVFGQSLYVEQRVDVPRIHPESWGTPDCALWHEPSLTLYLWDYKFGHDIVEVFENWQLITYAVGKLDEVTNGKALSETSKIKVVMTIVQPRAYHRNGPIRRWEIDAYDLRAYVNILKFTEESALGSNPMTRVGRKCRHCSARHVCETLQQASMDAIAYIGQPTPSQLDGASLGLELRLIREAMDVLKARWTGLEAQAEAMISHGSDVPGWALSMAYGRQAWAVGNDEVFAMGDMMGVELRKDPEPITPKQAIKAGIDEAVINNYSQSPKNGLKLVESDKTIAAAIFKKRTSE